MRKTMSAGDGARVGLLAAGGAAILYGASYPATAVALRSFTALGIAGLACTLALPVVIVLAFAGLLPQPAAAALNRASLTRLVVLAALGGFGFIAAANIAVALSGATVTGFVAPLYAVAAALLAVPILGERIRPITLAAFALALIGTALLAGVEPDAAAVAGVAAAGCAASLFGLYIVLARRWSRRYALDGTLITIANLVARGPVLLIVEFLRSPTTLIPADPDPGAVIALLTIGFGASSTANLLLMASVRRVPAARTSAALLLTPVSSAVIAAVVLGERLAPQQVLGAVLILIGIAGASGVITNVVLGRMSAGREGAAAVSPEPDDRLPGAEQG